MLGMVQTASNPNAMLQTLAQNNPQLRQVMDLVQEYGGSPEKAFLAACEQKGVNPQDIINMLK